MLALKNLSHAILSGISLESYGILYTEDNDIFTHTHIYNSEWKKIKRSLKKKCVPKILTKLKQTEIFFCIHVCVVYVILKSNICENKVEDVICLWLNFILLPGYKTKLVVPYQHPILSLLCCNRSQYHFVAFRLLKFFENRINQEKFLFFQNDTIVHLFFLCIYTINIHNKREKLYL